jgi:hypothetical protein
MGWDMDFVPVIANGLRWLEGGAFPAYGTLSSVAAYNMPFLVWLHLPALWLTRDPYATMLLTLLAWNALGTAYAYWAGKNLLDERVGLIAAALFTFSEVGVSGSYTAWAQLLLPTFYLLVWVHVERWRNTERGRHLALAGIFATAAMMTHFSAVLLYGALLLFALITRARWQWRWFMGGSAVCLALVAPYLAFQVERDFVDLRAFLTRQSTIPREVMAQFEQYSYNAPPSTPAEPAPLSAAPTLTNLNGTPEPPSRELRALYFVLSIPEQTLQGFLLFAQTSYGLFNTVLVLLFGSALALGVYRLGQQRWHYPTLTERLSRSDGGRALLLAGFCGVLIVGLIVTRASPSAQATYYLGLVGLQMVLVAYGLVLLVDVNLARHAAPLPTDQINTTTPALRKQGWGVRFVLVLIVLTYCFAQGAERIGRRIQHDDSAYTVQNVWLYRHIAATTDYLAAQWGANPTPPRIAYDLLPDLPMFWWIPAWHTVDPLYRLGAPYDFLLYVRQGIVNANQDPIGSIDQPDFIVTYTISLARYDLTQYRQRQFGTIVVLQPLRP